MFKNKKIFVLLLLGLFLISARSYAIDISNMYVIGDSLSDQGNCFVIGAPPPPVTNGNTYAYYLGKDFGFNILHSDHNFFQDPGNGTDYACVGASPGYSTPISIGLGIKADGLQQIQQLLADNNQKLDSKALYMYWMGANDIINAPPSQIVYPVFNAVTTTNNIAAGLNMMHNAGARYIVVLNMPPLEKTPSGLSDPTLGPYYASSAVALNQQLLNTLNNIGYEVIQLDIYSVMNYLLANAAEFGFQNVTTGCDPTYGNPVPGQTCATSFFFNDVHPSDKTHGILADFLYETLTAPDFVAALAQAPIQVINAQNSAIRQQLFPQQFEHEIGKFYPFYSQSGAMIQPATPSYATSDNRYANLSQTLGILQQVNENLLLGIAVGENYSFTDFPNLTYSQPVVSPLTGEVIAHQNVSTNNSSSFKFRSTDISLFGSYQRNKFYVNAILNYAWLNYWDVERKFYIGPVLESTNNDISGNQYGISVLTGFNFVNRPDFMIGPIVTLDYQRVNVNGYSETGADVFDLDYQDQSKDSFIAGIGWQTTFQVEPQSWYPILTNIFMTFNQEMTGGDRLIYFHQNSIAANFAGLPVLEPKTSFVTAGINFATKISKNIIASVGYTLSVGENDLRANFFTLALTMPL